MTTSYDRRIIALEQLHTRAALPPVRVYHSIISPDREVVGAYVEGQHFDRAEGESVDELRQRGLRAVGWDD